jgi:hypothetical protein
VNVLQNVCCLNIPIKSWNKKAARKERLYISVSTAKKQLGIDQGAVFGFGTIMGARCYMAIAANAGYKLAAAVHNKTTVA